MTWNSVPRDGQLQQLTLPALGTTITPADAQRLAEICALRGLGRVAPNPLVGAVLVDQEHRFLSAGAHEVVGSHHAEINALNAYNALPSATRPSLQGATLYVTLEPCAHANRTPACAPRVAASGIAQVVYGTQDPNPAVNGRGHTILQDAGIKTRIDQAWRSDCERLAEIFLWNIRHHHPFVALKAATSLDGYIARRGDQRTWITGERARAYGHFLRCYYDAIVVGQNTLIADDPLLDTRLSLISGRAPKRIVLDPDGAALHQRPQGNWRMVEQAASDVIWITGDTLDREAATALTALTTRGVNAIQLPTNTDGQFTPAAILAALSERGVTSILLEGGAGVYASFLNAGLVQKLHLFQAPQLLGGSNALAWTGGTGPLTIRADSTIEISPLDNDWLIEASLVDARSAEGRS